MRALLAETPFDRELEDSEFHPKVLEEWRPGKINKWLRDSFVRYGLIADDDPRRQILRQLADQYYIQMKCRYVIEHDDIDAKIGSAGVLSVLTKTQREIRDILRSFGIGREDKAAAGSGGGTIPAGEDNPDSAFA